MDLPNIKSSLKKCKGTTVFGSCEVDEIQDMEIRDDDIWVMSYPRSGTTLTQEIVYMIHSGLDVTKAKSSPLDERFPFLDLSIPEMPLYLGLTAIEEMTSPRLIKTHLHHHVLPPQLFKSKCKKIYVMRNPKDTFVSCLMLTKYLMQIEPDFSMEEYLDQWLSGETYAGPWWRHVRGFWEHNFDNTLLILKYEDIVKDMRKVVKQVGSHLQIQLDGDQINTILHHCHFDNMKSNDSVSAKWVENHRSVDCNFGGHIRKGRVGGWKEFFTVEMSAKVDKMVEEKLNDLDLDFDYDV